jgi:hypothetical protein
MSTEINITIGDQRLLQESKTRAAANQQSLDSRLEKQQLAEQLNEAVDEATPEDPRSDAFSLQLDRRPAAQRRKDKDEYKIARFANLFGKQLANSLQTFEPGVWFYTTLGNRTDGVLNCPALPPPSPITEPYTLEKKYTERVERPISTLNVHSDYSVQFAPTLSYAGTPYTIPVYTVSNVTERLKYWITYTNLFLIETENFCFPTGTVTTSAEFVKSDGPTFPRTTLSSKPVILFQRVSSTSSYLYFSTLIRTRTYVPVEAGFNSIGIIDLPTESTQTVFISLKNSTQEEYGYYVRFNVKTLTVEAKIVLLRSSPSDLSLFLEPDTPPGRRKKDDQGLVPTPSLNEFQVLTATRREFVSNLYPGDPRLSLYGADLVTTQALDSDINYFSYEPSTGAAYFYGQHTTDTQDSPDNLSPSAYVYFTEFGKNTPYQEVVTVLKQAKLTLLLLTTAPVVLTGSSFTQQFTLKQSIPLGGISIESPPRERSGITGLPQISEILAIVPQA